MKNHFDFRYFTKNILTVIGLVFIWRGIWVILDLIDKLIFGDSHIVTAILGILIGIAVLYLPDKDLKTLERL